jgi:hypothetical protein
LIETKTPPLRTEGPTPPWFTDTPGARDSRGDLNTIVRVAGPDRWDGDLSMQR